MSTYQNDNQFEDVTIDSVVGLDRFFENIEEIYRDAKQHASRLVSSDGRERALESLRGSLRNQIEALKKRVHEGKSVLEVDAVKLQETYDRLVTLHQELQKIPKHQERKPDHVNRNDSQRNKKQQQHKKQNSKKPQHTHQSTREVRGNVKERIEQLQLTYKKLIELHDDSSVAESILLDEAKDTYEHATLLKAELQHTYDEKKAEAFLLHAEAHMQEIRKALKDVANSRPQFDRMSKKMDICASDTEVVVPIRADNVTKPPQRTSFVPASIATQPKQNPVKRNVPKELVALPRTNSVHEKQSLTDKYLRAPRYQSFISEHFSSPGGFERILDSTVTKIEASTVDTIERWLGETPASAFEFIKDMSIEEVQAFAVSGYDVTHARLEKENIKYETFVAWTEVLDVMVEALQPPPHISFGELFAIFMIESEMSTHEASLVE